MIDLFDVPCFCSYHFSCFFLLKSCTDGSTQVTHARPGTSQNSQLLLGGQGPADGGFWYTKIAGGANLEGLCVDEFFTFGGVEQVFCWEFMKLVLMIKEMYSLV